MKIHVGNLAYNVTEEDLRAVFAGYGEVSSVNVIKDRSSGQSKGFGFVEMPDNSEADKAMKGLNGTRLKDQIIRLSQAKPPSRRQSGGFRH